MTFEEARNYFGSTAKLADAIGVSKFTAHHWKQAGSISLVNQFKIERITNGDLVADYPLPDPFLTRNN